MIQEVERILEAQDRQMSEESQFAPPQGFIDTPCTFYWGTIPNRRYPGEEQESREPLETTSIRRMGGQGGRTAFKSPHSPDQECQKEERDSVIDAVKQITRAQTETPEWGDDCGSYPRVSLGYRL